MTYNEFAGTTSIKELRDKVTEEHNVLLDKEIEIINFFNELGFDFPRELGHSLDMRNYNFLTSNNRLAILEEIKDLWEYRTNVFMHNVSDKDERKLHEAMCKEHEDFIRLTFLARVAKIFINIDTMEKELADYDDWTVDDVLSSEFYITHGLYVGYEPLAKLTEKTNEEEAWKEFIKKERANPINKLKTFSIVFSIISVIAVIVFGICVYLGYFILSPKAIVTCIILVILGLVITNTIPSILRKKFNLV